jgi:hypothetical protein
MQMDVTVTLSKFLFFKSPNDCFSRKIASKKNVLDIISLDYVTVECLMEEERRKTKLPFFGSELDLLMELSNLLDLR